MELKSEKQQLDEYLKEILSQDRENCDFIYSGHPDDTGQWRPNLTKIEEAKNNLIKMIKDNY